jgi:hypothetical protein
MTTVSTEPKFVREKIRQVVIEHEIVKLEALLRIQSELLENGTSEGFGERMGRAAILQESIVARATELRILVQDSDIVKH